MRLRSVLVLLIICPTVYCQNLPQPLTQVEACRTFRDSIVKVDTDTMHGTGFVASADGWVVTALHVIADQKTLTKYGNISVTVVGYSHPIPAEIASPIDDLARKRDFAILKIDKTALPSLELGSEVYVEDGSPIAIIGFPLSASFSVPVRSIPRFCLAGTVATQTAFPLGGLNFIRTIYFQGVSIKGISGAPIISLQTGKVVGIVSTRMTGIGSALQKIRDEGGSTHGLPVAKSANTRLFRWISGATKLCGPPCGALTRWAFLGMTRTMTVTRLCSRS